ncbi:MAG: alpha/beta hydrolase, partial [Chromatiales bacterium]|nr:alpha/beta hydrolase [Chromatiales bacterium]
LNLQAEEITIDYNGLKLNANLEKAGDNWRDGPVILMTHGTLGHNRMEIMATLQELFTEREISSLAINLSYGLSARESSTYDCATPHDHKHTDALDEIGEWLRWLSNQGVKSVVLLGHSRGGNQTAWFSAERDGDIVSKVILIAPSVWDEKKQTQGYLTRYNKPLAPVLNRATRLVDARQGEQQISPVDFIYCADTTATARAFVSYYQSEPRMDTPTLIKGITKPLLVIAGSEDSVVEGLIEAMEGMAQENLQFEVIDGADHMFRDLYAEEVADMVTESLP